MMTNPTRQNNTFDSIVARIIALRREHPPPLRGFRKKVRHVVILASSSRGGSSLTAELLRRSTSMLHFRGEMNLFLKLSGHSYPQSNTGSDALCETDLGNAELLETLFGYDIGRPYFGIFSDMEERLFSEELYFRLSVQWPFEIFCPYQVRDWVRKTITVLVKEHGWKPYSFEDTKLFHLIFLKYVKSKHPKVNPWYYDIPSEWIRYHFPNNVPLNALPSPLIIEEPPFITVGPWRNAVESDLDKPLIIKTPSNVFRLNFLRAFFPNATLRIIHLTRNAAASINGLYDGWRFRGFFAYDLKGRLDIKDYSDDGLPYGKNWWKFDLPPFWENFTSKSLWEVCRYQWLGAHHAVFDFVERNDIDTKLIRFEDLIDTKERQMKTIKKLLDWLIIPIDRTLVSAIERGLPPIMATHPLEKSRWLKRYDIIHPLIRQPEVLETMERMGYKGEELH